MNEFAKRTPYSELISDEFVFGDGLHHFTKTPCTATESGKSANLKIPDGCFRKKEEMLKVELNPTFSQWAF